MARLVVFNLLIESAMVALFAVAGTVEAWLAVVFFIVNMAVSIGFYVFIRLGLNLKLKDQGPLVPQSLVHGIVQLGFLVAAPQISFVFLVALLVWIGYAAIDFTPRQFVVAWVLYGSGSAAAILLSADRFGYPGTSVMQVTLYWLYFFMALGCLALASARISRLRDKLAEKNRLLRESLLRIESLASRDHLTGVLNRRNFMEILEAELRRTARTGQEFCFAMLDLDNFKSINDRYGHPVGDLVLKAVCDTISGGLRASDRLARLGGEEFAILLPVTPLQQGTVTLERLNKAVRECDWNAIAPGLEVSFSCGISAPVAEETLQSLIKRADEALYAAKRTGKNRVVLAEASRASSEPDHASTPTYGMSEDGKWVIPVAGAMPKPRDA